MRLSETKAKWNLFCFLQRDHEEHESDKMMVVLKAEMLKCFYPQITKDQLLLTWYFHWYYIYHIREEKWNSLLNTRQIPVVDPGAEVPCTLP